MCCSFDSREVCQDINWMTPDDFRGIPMRRLHWKNNHNRRSVCAGKDPGHSGNWSGERNSPDCSFVWKPAAGSALWSLYWILFCVPWWDVAVWGSWACGIEWDGCQCVEVPTRGSLGSKGRGKRGHGFPIGCLIPTLVLTFISEYLCLSGLSPAARSMWTTGFNWM